MRNAPGLAIRALAVTAFLATPAGRVFALPSPTPELSDSSTLTEIVVTAERRETNLQTTAIAVSVLGGNEIEQQHIQSVLDLNSLPNMNINSGLEGKAQIAIRGIGEQDLNPGNEGRVAFYVDGVYVAAPEAQLGTFFDVDRLEVLRGPQGTLYGRNATGGAFNVITRKPTVEDSGYLDVTGGNFGLIQTAGALSGPISNSLLGRIAFQTVDRQGWGRNIHTGDDIDDSRTQSVRGQLEWKPTSSLDVLLQASYHREKDSNYAIHYFGYPTSATPLLTTLGFPVLSYSRDENTDVQPSNQRDSRSLTLKTIFDISNSLKFTSILAYGHSRAVNVNDDDGTPYPGTKTSDIDNLSEYTAEFQLAGNMSHNHWLVGVYYFRDTDTPVNRYELNGVYFGLPAILYQGGIQTSNLETNAYAGFGQFTQEFTDRFSVTVGARYTKEEKDDRNDYQGLDFSTPYNGVSVALPAAVPGFPFSQSTSFSNFSPMITLDYRFTPDIYGYGTVSKGFKSGGFNYGALQPNIFKPETILDYEIGLKTSFFEHKLRANIAAFYYDYKNIQSVIIVPNPQIPGFVKFEVSNAGAAKSYGVELELAARPIPEFQVDLTASALHATYENLATEDATRPELGVLNLEGNRIPQSPDYVIDLGGQYTWQLRPGSLTARGDYKRVGNTYFTVFNCCGLDQPAYGWGDAFLTFERRDAHWSATAFIRNISNVVTVGGLFQQAGFLASQTAGSQGAPRTYGLTVGFKW